MPMLFRGMAITIAFMWLGSLPAEAASIASVEDLIANSVTGGGNEYVLNPGNHTITPGSNIAFAANSLTLNTVSTALTADNTGQSGTMLNLFRLTVGPGAVNAIGGQSSSPHALYTRGVVINDGAIVNTRGGAAGSASGIWTTTDGVVQNGGGVTATGGSGSLSAGMYLAGGSYMMNGGALVASGGSGMNSAGVRVVSGGLALLGGVVTARGGIGNRQSSGIYVTGAAGVTVNGGSLIAAGGDDSQNYGLYTQYRVQVDSGSVTTQGGTGSNTAGIRLVLGDFYQNGGTVNATAGTGFVAAGIYGPSNNYVMNGGTLNAFGGGGDDSHGVMLSTLSLQKGLVSATGGGASLSRGISVNAVNQTGGILEALGATNSPTAASVAVYAGNYTLTGGAVRAVGGGGTRTRGLYVANTFSLANAALTATGGGGSEAYGLDALYIRQDGGLIVARGGAAQNNAYGINIRAGGGASIAGGLRLERQEDAASLYLSAGANLDLRTNSLLVPVVDMAKIDSSPLTSSGVIMGDGNVTISGGAEVSPLFIDTRNLVKNRVVTSLPFISLSGAGSIAGEFAGANAGYFLEYSVEKTSNQTYVIHVVRNHEVIKEAPYLECANSRGLVVLMDEVLNLQPANRLAGDVWTQLDNSRSLEDWRRRAAHIGKTMAPLAYTKLTHSLARLADRTRYDVSRQLAGLAAGRQAVSPWQAWASPLYQQSSRYGAVCYEFDDVKEEFYGGALGLGRNLGAVAFGAAYHYVRGKNGSEYTDIKTDNLGFTAGARIHDILPTDGRINPWLSVALGYIWSDIDIKGLSYDRLAKSATPNARTFSAEAELGNRFQILGNLALSPKIGVEYAHVAQGGYTDKSPSAYIISVAKGRYESLKPKISVDLDLRITDRFSLTARAQYRYETMDRWSSFYTEAVNLPTIRFMAEGEKLRRGSGRFGLGAAYRIDDRAAVQFNYDLSLAEKYMAHQFNAGVSLAF